ncbi:MAG: cation diffusion facilitator family transporter [Myxococcales bacterium]
MSQPSSFKAVVAALAGNVVITIAKFVAFFLSGSGAMLSEAVHSVADTGNQALLFVGLRRAAREKDPEFPYGYGAERFVFGILSAAGIFFVGSGVTVYHGIHSLLHPQMPEIGVVTFAVLGVSTVIELVSISVAIGAINKTRGDKPFLRYLFDGADPAAMAIVFEDGAALLGLVLAALGIALSYWTGNGLWDALGSTLIGVLLGFVALFLAEENRELLLGKAIPEKDREAFRDIVAKTPGVRHVHDIKTRMLTPETYKLKAEITLDEGYIASRLDAVLPPAGTLTPEARTKALAALADASAVAVSDLIDEVEKRVKAAIPEAAHIDLEVDHTDEGIARGRGSQSAAPAA